ncbi:chloramphenicol O-acetyltransferase [Lachnospiraceae bacterium JC7]|nr:chloramphenicol O-acetyltransferase [Lachnospiraceae bacterium JC7]
MVKEIKPEETSRESAFYLWMKAPNPMVTLFKKINVTNLVKVSKKRRLKFNMLMDYCIGKAASEIKEFYILPVDDKLIQYDDIAVNTIVKNKNGEVNSCDLLFSEDIEEFNKEYLKNTTETAEKCMDRDLSADHMIIGTSTIVETEIEGAVNIYSGFNNPFIVWGRYSKTLFSYHMMLSFQFHHTQMDGAHAGRFLQNLQNEIDSLK